MLMWSVPSWLFENVQNLVDILIQAPLAFVVIFLLTRLGGLRSTSKMSSTDFFITLAIGSVFGSAVMSRSMPLADAAVALIMLFGIKALLSHLKHFNIFQKVLDNSPELLMIGEHLQENRMSRHAVTKEDICAKLREANVTHSNQVLAVVLESTGDLSVIWGREDEVEVDYHLFRGVKGQELLKEVTLPERFVWKDQALFEP